MFIQWCCWHILKLIPSMYNSLRLLKCCTLDIIKTTIIVICWTPKTTCMYIYAYLYPLLVHFYWNTKKHKPTKGIHIAILSIPTSLVLMDVRMPGPMSTPSSSMKACWSGRCTSRRIPAVGDSTPTYWDWSKNRVSVRPGENTVGSILISFHWD